MAATVAGWSLPPPEFLRPHALDVERSLCRQHTGHCGSHGNINWQKPYAGVERRDHCLLVKFGKLPVEMANAIAVVACSLPNYLAIERLVSPVKPFLAGRGNQPCAIRHTFQNARSIESSLRCHLTITMVARGEAFETCSGDPVGHRSCPDET